MSDTAGVGPTAGADACDFCNDAIMMEAADPGSARSSASAGASSITGALIACVASGIDAGSVAAGGTSSETSRAAPFLRFGPLARPFRTS